MSETAIIELPEGERTITLEDLERIKRALLQALQNKAPAEDYSHLVTELEHQSAPMILPDGTARIGSWQLIVRNGAPLMERQQVPRAPVMLFYEAPLSIEDGRWVVADVGIKKVRGR